jgi:hypothetical protein
MSKQKLQKLIQQMSGKKKKKVKRPDPRTEALRGRKHFADGTNPMIRQAQTDYNGSFMGGSSLGGVRVGNKSLESYYPAGTIPKGFIKG